jgi:hypothetical protein
MRANSATKVVDGEPFGVIGCSIMATEEKIEGRRVLVTLSVKEAVEIVTLLTAQIANVPLPGNASGAAPSVSVNKHGQLDHYLIFIVDRNQPR